MGLVGHDDDVEPPASTHGAAVLVANAHAGARPGSRCLMLEVDRTAQTGAHQILGARLERE